MERTDSNIYILTLLLLTTFCSSFRSSQQGLGKWVVDFVPPSSSLPKKTKLSSIIWGGQGPGRNLFDNGKWDLNPANWGIIFSYSRDELVGREGRDEWTFSNMSEQGGTIGDWWWGKEREELLKNLTAETYTKGNVVQDVSSGGSVDSLLVSAIVAGMVPRDVLEEKGEIDWISNVNPEDVKVEIERLFSLKAKGEGERGTKAASCLVLSYIVR